LRYKFLTLSQTKTAYIQLHIAVLLFGFTAILGNLIDMSAVMIVWWRVLITSISLFFLIKFRRDVLSLPRVLILKYLGIGVLIALHWICFYGAIKLANSSIALICVATVAFFTSMLEPIINRRKVDPVELLLGFLIIPGMYVIVQNVDASYVAGIWAGLAAAFLAALFSILNKRYINDASAHLTAFASNLVFNFEPLYGIVLAAILLKEYEQLTTGFYIGGTMIISIVLLHPMIQKWRKQ